MTPSKVAEQVTSLKGLFKGKGELLILADACIAQRDALIHQTLPSMLDRARVSPLHLLPVQLSHQATQAGTTFLRWRRIDRTAMGVTQWQALLLAPSTPSALISTLYRLEQQRVLINAQISLTHALAQLARTSIEKLTHAERIYHQRRECVAREAP